MRYLRIGLVFACCLLVPSVAAASVTKTQNGHRLSVMMRDGVKPAGRTGSTKGGGVLLAHGGPVLSSEAPYLIYWTPSGYSISSASENLLNQYLSDTAAAARAASTTNVYSVLAQYGAPYSQTFAPKSQALIDSDPYPAHQTRCTVAAGMTGCVTDSSIQTEIASLIDAKRVTTPTAPGTGTTPIFFLITPVNVNVCLGGNTCSSNNFCAYHSFFTHNGMQVLYASVPFSVFANGNTKGCQTDQYSIYETPVGSSGDEAYNIADDLSHELSETITDPLINAWYSKNGLEVGDLCEAYAATADPAKGLSPLAYSPAFGDPSAGTLYDQIINGHEYYNQTEFSNAANGCLPGITPLG